MLLASILYLRKKLVFLLNLSLEVLESLSIISVLFLQGFYYLSLFTDLQRLLLYFTFQLAYQRLLLVNL